MSPGFGTIPPGGQQIVNVECLADQLGKSEEFLALDISDRHPEDQPNGIPFRLISEVCTPGKAQQGPVFIHNPLEHCTDVIVVSCFFQGLSRITLPAYLKNIVL